jgi:hypothetical protein
MLQEMDLEDEKMKDLVWAEQNLNPKMMRSGLI